MYFDAANFFEPSLRLAAEVYGPQQVIAGSDIPYFQEEKYVRAFDYIRTSKLTDDEKEGVLSANAKTLYGWTTDANVPAGWWVWVKMAAISVASSAKPTISGRSQ